MNEPASSASADGQVTFRHAFTPEMPELLARIGATLFLSTYQAGKLVVVRSTGTGISTLLRTFDQPMGLALDQRRLALGARSCIWQFRNAPDIAAQLPPPGRHDACFLPRISHVTGDIRCHEIGWAGDELWIVNTRFSCLCTLNADYSFLPRWRPPFVTQLAADDRCHLNGLAIVDGKPKYVTALGESDTSEGWRSNKAKGGILIDAPSGEVVAGGLSMPHSPRFHQGRLYVLDSGTGRLAAVDLQTGRLDTVSVLPGYTRGLAFCGRFAFVGLSKIRETSTFGGLPVTERFKKLKCGVGVVDTANGHCQALLEFHAGVEEIFDVCIVVGVRYPAVIGFERDTIHGAFVVPRESADNSLDY